MAAEPLSFTFQVSPEESGLRLDAFLAAKIEGWSRSRLQKLIDTGDILLNGKQAKSSYKLRINDEIDGEISETIVASIEPEDIRLDAVYEDSELIVLNKASGLVVHTGAGIYSGTLANAVAFHCREQSGGVGINQRFGIVHRLDKLTSGLIVVAKNIAAHEALSSQFRERRVFKQYLALVHGYVKEDAGRIDLPIGRDRNNRTKMAISENGRNALSLWKVKERFNAFTLLNVEIKTGRTHQIRVHLAHFRHGVVGDEAYNAGRDSNFPTPGIRRAIASLGRFFLHAEKLAFFHPVSGERLEFEAPLPEELQNFLEIIRQG